MSDTRAPTNTRKAARPGETHAATGVLGVAPFASIAVIELAGTLGPAAAVTAAGVGAVAAYRHVTTHRPRNPNRKHRTTGAKSSSGVTVAGKRGKRRGAVHVPGSGRRKGHGNGSSSANPFGKRSKVAGRGKAKTAAASVGATTRKGASSKHGHGTGSLLGGKKHGGTGSRRRSPLAGWGKRKNTGSGHGSGAAATRKNSSGTGGKSRRLFGIGRRKNSTSGAGSTKRRGGLFGFLRGGGSSTNSVGKLAKQQRKKRKKDQNRRKYRRILDRFKRNRKANKRFGNHGKPRDKVRRIAGGLWGAGRFSAMCLRVAGELTWYATAHAGHGLGNRVRALNKESVAFLAVPFAGLGTDVRRLIDRVRLRFATVEDVPASTVTATATPKFGPVISEGSSMSDEEFYCDTNLRPLIEAIRNGSALGDGEKPHALVVMQWHKDLRELYEALGERIAADAEIAANTLPVSGDAHEITVHLGRSAMGHAGEVAEGYEAWKEANGTRVDRLVSDEENKELWDWSTRPQ